MLYNNDKHKARFSSTFRLDVKRNRSLGRMQFCCWPLQQLFVRGRNQENKKVPGQMGFNENCEFFNFVNFYLIKLLTLNIF